MSEINLMDDGWMDGLKSHNNTHTTNQMHILNQVQFNLIYSTNRNLFTWIKIFISTTDLYNTTANRWSCHLPNRNKKRKSSLFEPPFGRLRGNVRTSPTSHWNAHVRVPIRHNWTSFASCYCWDVTGGNLSTWTIFLKGVGHFDRPF